MNPFPIFTFAEDGVEVEKKLFMLQGQNTTVFKYRLLNAPGNASARLELRPLIAFRDYHSLTHENGAINGRVVVQEELISIAPYQGLPDLYMANNAAVIDGIGHWYRNFEYDAERERALDFQEDLFTPCVLRFDLSPPRGAMLISSVDRHRVSAADQYEQDEVSRRRQIAQRTPVKTTSSLD